ncbi:hypothetical protein ACIPY2_19175 [Paenarthrobacter sp. NPDC089675]|uniref:hypothetical protein n=1 Tax=Paenarthrobacter sp. NPDC089675 TaxID=3364376 RepID=UPI0037FBF4AC
MPDQIILPSSNSGAAHAAADSLGTHPAGTAEAFHHPGEVPGQNHAVGSVREQFNPLGVGLRSIWPQSVCGF